MRSILNRFKWLDNLKGFAIALVVLGHCIQYFYNNPSDNHVYNYIYSFHMPLFFLLSGYCTYKPILQWDIVQKRTVQLLIPYVCFTLLSCWISKRCLLNALIINPMYWFLIVLFFIIVINLFVIKISERFKINSELLSVIVFICLIVITPRLRFLSFNSLYFYYFFFLIGFYLKKYNSAFDIILTNSCVLGILFVLYSILGYFFQLGKSPFSAKIIPPSFYYMVTGAVGSFFFFILFKNYFNRTIFLLSMMGYYTLGIYVVHCLFRLIISDLISDCLFLLTPFLRITILFIFLTLSSFYVCRLVARIPILSRTIGMKYKNEK